MPKYVQLTESNKHVPKTSCAFLEVPNGMFYILEVLRVIFLIFGRNSQDVFEILHRIFWKFFMGFSAFLEVPHWIVRILEVPYEILCIIGSSSWDYLHLWKFLVGFCALFEVNHGILCIFRRSSWDFVHYFK
jgi:hypothetical protein